MKLSKLFSSLIAVTSFGCIAGSLASCSCNPPKSDGKEFVMEYQTEGPVATYYAAKVEEKIASGTSLTVSFKYTNVLTELSFVGYSTGVSSPILKMDRSSVEVTMDGKPLEYKFKYDTVDAIDITVDKVEQNKTVKVKFTTAQEFGEGTLNYFLCGPAM